MSCRRIGIFLTVHLQQPTTMSCSDLSSSSEEPCKKRQHMEKLFYTLAFHAHVWNFYHDDSDSSDSSDSSSSDDDSTTVNPYLKPLRTLYDMLQQQHHGYEDDSTISTEDNGDVSESEYQLDLRVVKSDLMNCRRPLLPQLSNSSKPEWIDIEDKKIQPDNSVFSGESSEPDDYRSYKKRKLCGTVHEVDAAAGINQK
jgi:hypothetical protein